MSINNFVRTQNYRLTVAQLNSANARISELEGQVQGLQVIEDKAEGFELLAEKDGIKNTIKTFKIYVEVKENAAPVFDNKSTTKAIKLSGISVKEGSASGKVIPVAKFEEVQTISTTAGAELCQIREVEFGEVTIAPTTWTCGDLAKCSNIKVPASSAIGTSEFAIDNPYVKQNDNDAPFGALSVNSAVFTVSAASANDKFYVCLEVPANSFVANPIPAKAQ